MYSKFYSLEQEKRERIINAALKEFAKNGYEKASTNEIIKEAEISKGSLFNYFKNKKQLYLFLLDYVVTVIDEIYEEMDWNITDLFERMRALGLIKFKIMQKYPQAFNFIKNAAQEDAADVNSEIETLEKSIVESGLERGYKDLDLTKFREDMDIQKIMNIINWTILSFAEQQRDQVNSFEELDMEVLKEWEDYFDILKRCFYKKEEE
ncbi:TetR/AcrR family transcriptional regulator [Sinanaerobacter chloroacetimidivorans]|uniref:TetR/AcrR family transcriptional regulator n=1 Tax=Sinanaerobacter chloroacetimidivorans TaxID=2818044 RepID=A0A8J7W4V5_9FIRM|nr:TetR/AcrR family transcriptional regulator [Sinanaerobacter chloroacetimidivorans]MBR0599398.1 TetR/AcrR family transcriptional regulator [Sinanaerobacter chloroacetimidivorans]